MNPSSVEQLAANVTPASMVALASDLSGVPMTLVRALVRRSVRQLHLVCLPTSGLAADLLIGTGCVATIETAGVTLGEYGPARRFSAAIQNGQICIRDATCPALHAGFRAAAAGLPFIPLRGLLGSDLLREHPDWRVINNPYAQDPDPIVLIQAIQPDFALFHAPYADSHGNIFIGARRELFIMAQAARQSLVTVEEIRDTDLLADQDSTAGVLPAVYGADIAVAPRGAWPLAFWDRYVADNEALTDYACAARSEIGFQSWLQRCIWDSPHPIAG